MFIPWPISTIYSQLQQVLDNQETIMADFSKLTAAVTALQASINSAVTDLQGLTADIAALKGSVDATVQPQIDAITQQLTDTTTSLSSAVSANPA